MTDSLTVEGSAETTTDDDDIESELFFSAREAGVSSFALPGSEVEGGATRPLGWGAQ